MTFTLKAVSWILQLILTFLVPSHPDRRIYPWGVVKTNSSSHQPPGGQPTQPPTDRAPQLVTNSPVQEPLPGKPLKPGSSPTFPSRPRRCVRQRGKEGDCTTAAVCWWLNQPMSQNGFIFPNFFGAKIINFRNHHLSWNSQTKTASYPLSTAGMFWRDGSSCQGGICYTPWK